MRKREKEKKKNNNEETKGKKKETIFSKKFRKERAAKNGGPKFCGRNANFHENRTPDFTQLAPNFTCKHYLTH
jgi:hypothetical protein